MTTFLAVIGCIAVVLAYLSLRNKIERRLPVVGVRPGSFGKFALALMESGDGAELEFEDLRTRTTLLTTKYSTIPNQIELFIYLNKRHLDSEIELTTFLESHTEFSLAEDEQRNCWVVLAILKKDAKASSEKLAAFLWKLFVLVGSSFDASFQATIRHEKPCAEAARSIYEKTLSDTSSSNYQKEVARGILAKLDADRAKRLERKLEDTKSIRRR